jgi:hypothetical protein
MIKMVKKGNRGLFLDSYVAKSAFRGLGVKTFVPSSQVARVRMEESDIPNQRQNYY